jgi:WD40 repeat protein
MSDTSQTSTFLAAEPLTTMTGHKKMIQKLAYLPRGKRLATCSHDGTVRMWDVEKGKQEGTSMVHKGDTEVYSLAVTRDGKRILSGGAESGDPSIRVWDVETHEQLEEWGSHTGLIRCISLSPDNRLAASVGDDGKIMIREMEESGEIKYSIDTGGGVDSLCFSPNGEKLACAINYNTDRVFAIQIYNVKDGQLVMAPIRGHEKPVNCVLWSVRVDGNQLFSASEDHTIRCWDLDMAGESIGKPWTGHTGIVHSLSLSPDGARLASASEDGTIRLWDVRSGHAIHPPLRRKTALFAVAFSPSGEFVASGGRDGQVSIWRAPWWDNGQKQVITTFTCLPTLLLTVFLVTDTSFLARNRTESR